MRNEQHGKGHGNNAGALDGSPCRESDTFWKCSGSKGCCYIRFNNMDDAVCFACNILWGQAITTRPSATPTSNRFSGLETGKGGTGKGQGKKGEDSRQTWANTQKTKQRHSLGQDHPSGSCRPME